jgi:transposase-like protein
LIFTASIAVNDHAFSQKPSGSAAVSLRPATRRVFPPPFTPREHQRQIRTNNMLERVMREIRRRTRVVGAFPDGRSALMLAAARLRYVSGSRWGTRRYLDMNRLKEMQDSEAVRADNAAA